MELTKGQTLKYFIGLCIPHSYSCRFELSKELFLQFEIGTFELQILWKCHLHFSREKGRGLGLYTGVQGGFMTLLMVYALIFFTMVMH